MKTTAALLVLAVASACQFGCQKTDNISNSGNGNSTASSTPTATAKPSPFSHCGDSPPANPSKCTIDQQFVASCTPPWSDPQNHEIDAKCPVEGCAKRPSATLPNQVQNNFCRTGTPVEINVASIDQLQKDVDDLVSNHQLSYGKDGGPPASRDQLKTLATVDANNKPVTLAEGALVTFEAFVLDAKHDDTFPFGFGGEGVNCNNSLFDWNDIHVALGQTASEEECKSVTAEIIPHFRSALWDRFDSDTCTAPHVTNPLPVKGLRVRITGQLFFDGSHDVIACGAPPNGNPARRSVWEIHPAYAIEVFDTAKNQFVTLETWASGK